MKGVISWKQMTSGRVARFDIIVLIAVIRATTATSSRNQTLYDRMDMVVVVLPLLWGAVFSVAVVFVVVAAAATRDEDGPAPPPPLLPPCRDILSACSCANKLFDEIPRSALTEAACDIILFLAADSSLLSLAMIFCSAGAVVVVGICTAAAFP